jgi:heptosyltransferase III
MATSLLVYRPGAIGDTILTLPALAALRRRFPTAEITWAGNDACLPLLPVEHTMSADDTRLLPLFADPPRPIADLHIVFARQPLGLPGIQRDPLEALARRIHMVDWLVDAVDPSSRDRVPHVDGQALGGKPSPAVGSDMRRSGTNDLAHRSSASEESPSFVIHPGAGGAAKRWPEERFQAVAEALQLPLAIVQGPADPEPRIAYPHALWRHVPLIALAQRLAGSRLFLGNDSGISHLAAALGTPTVAVYVATDPAVWGVRGERTRAPNGEAERVMAACRELLSS